MRLLGLEQHSNNPHPHPQILQQFKEESPKICLIFLVLEFLVKVEENMLLLVLLHPMAQPPSRGLASFLVPPHPNINILLTSAASQLPAQGRPVGLLHFAGATPSPGMLSLHPSLLKSSGHKRLP